MTTPNFKLFLPLLILIILMPAVVQAVVGLVPCGDGSPAPSVREGEPHPNSGSQMLDCDFSDLLLLVMNVILYIIKISALLATLTIVAGGIKYVVFASNEAKRSEAKSMIYWAIIGLVVVLAAWLIVDFVLDTLWDSSIGPSPLDRLDN